MDALGIECLSMFGLHPALHIRLAGELGCGHVSLSLHGAANRLPQYFVHSIRDDAALRREIITALAASGVQVSLIEGFALGPETSARDLAGSLDIAAELGARAICAISLDRDVARRHAEFACLAEMAAQRGLLTTTEVGAGTLRNLDRAVEAVRQVGRSDFTLLLDTMHFFRSGAGLADLAALDPGQIGHIQLCDVPMPAVLDQYMEDALIERRCPGEGDLPLARFLSLVPAGVPIGLEVPIRSEAEVGTGPKQRLSRCVIAARGLLAQVHSSTPLGENL